MLWTKFIDLWTFYVVCEPEKICELFMNFSTPSLPFVWLSGHASYSLLVYSDRVIMQNPLNLSNLPNTWPDFKTVVKVQIWWRQLIIDWLIPYKSGREKEENLRAWKHLLKHMHMQCIARQQCLFQYEAWQSTKSSYYYDSNRKQSTNYKNY